MKNLKKLLKYKFKDAKRIAILGIGSELRGDDAAGILAAKQIRCFLVRNPKVRIFIGATAPENLTCEIKKYKPTHLIIIDSAELHKKPGTIALLDPNKIGGVTFSTHNLPVKVMADYLIKSIDCKIIIIGIQPKSLEFGSSVSKEVMHSIKILSTTLNLI